MHLRSLRLAIASASVTWTALLPWAAHATAASGPGSIARTLAWAVYAAGSVVCHQRPDRSFHLSGLALPVCARCTGIYAGAAGVFLLHRVIPRRDGRMTPLQWFLAAAAPTMATLVWEWTTGHVVSNGIRAAAGLPLGMVGAALVLHAFDADVVKSMEGA